MYNKTQSLTMEATINNESTTTEPPTQNDLPLPFYLHGKAI